MSGGTMSGGTGYFLKAVRKYPVPPDMVPPDTSDPLSGCHPSDKKNKEPKGEQKMENTEQIDIAEFAKADLRVAKVIEAQKIEGADRLLLLQIELGDERRQIVAGIAQHYTPEELIGKKVVVVANLKPAKIRGVESHGMLLAASGNETVSILTPLKDVPAGSKVK